MQAMFDNVRKCFRWKCLVWEKYVTVHKSATLTNREHIELAFL